MAATFEEITAWVNMLDTELADDLVQGLRRALMRLTEGHDHIAGVALYSDSDASTLVPAALTAAWLGRLQAQHPELADHHPWMVDEWDLQLGDDDPFKSVTDRINEHAEQIDDDDWIEWTDTVWSWVTEVMLGQRSWFDQTYPAANVVFHVTDEDIPVETLVEWANLLNPPERASTFPRDSR